MADPTLRLYDGYTTTSPEMRPHVEELQNLLKRNGFPVELDGRFGPKTEMAVEQFQRDRRLEIDGIVGRDTWAALSGAYLSDEFKATFPTTIHVTAPAHMKILEAAELYREAIEATAERIGQPASVIAGIGSRETLWGTARALDKPGPGGRGDYGHGHGLMQIDDRSHTAWIRSHDWADPAVNIDYAGDVLSGSLRYAADKSNLTGRPLLRAGLAGYNCGPGNVQRALRRGLDVDYYTAGRDYSKDVLNRAGWFQLHGWG